MIKRSSWIEVNLDNIEHNFKVVKNTIDENVKVMAVVKADAYGHGDMVVTKTLISAGVDQLGVATLEEGIVIRNKFSNIPILILGYTSNAFAYDVIENNLMQMVSDYDTALSFDRIAGEMNKKALVHIKVDTGMSRMGFLDDEQSIQDMIKIFNFKNTKVVGIFTHFANAGEEDASLTREQGERFLALIDRLKKENIEIPLVHAANSAAVMRFKDYHFDMVRPGIMLYGSRPSKLDCFKKFDLKEAMSLKTVIARVKKITKGQGVGYGFAYKLPQDEYIATLPLGYADGLRRIINDDFRVLVGSEYYPIVGNVCMDQLMISLKNNETHKIGDVVTIFGKSKGEFQSIEEFADAMNELNYELLTKLGLRLSKVYYYKGTLFDV